MKIKKLSKRAVTALLALIIVVLCASFSVGAVNDNTAAVTFHSNSTDIFAVYNVNEENKISPFYDIPKTEGEAVFKGWYYGTSDNAQAVDFENDTFTKDTDIYAQWIEIGEIDKDEKDKNIIEGITYKTFDLEGVQIRDNNVFDKNSQAIRDGGLRFVSVLSEDMLKTLDSLSDKKVVNDEAENDVEYGYLLTKSSNVTNWLNYAGDKIDASSFKLNYNGTDVNGVDTTVKGVNYCGFVTNVDCTASDYSTRQITDHRNYDEYRLFTVVINYDADESEATSENIAARAYLRYYDANEQLRTYYDDYNGTDFYGGCSTSYNDVKYSDYKIVYSYKDRFDNDKKYVVNATVETAKLGDKSYIENVVNNNAPYITDIRKTCVWNADTAVVSNDNKIYVEATQNPISHYVYFNSDSLVVSPAETMTSGSPIAENKVKKQYDDLITIEAKSTDANGQRFLYWQTTDVDKNGNLLAKTTKPICYTTFYSYRVLNNIFLEPVYGDSTSDEWTITLGGTVYTREQSTDNDGENLTDYVYADNLISIISKDSKVVIDDYSKFKFGVILEKDINYSYTGGTIEYPTEHKDYIKSLVEKYADYFKNGGRYHKMANDHEYFIYDRTDSAGKLTNMNRISSYERFDNDDINRGDTFNIYAYLIVKDENGQNRIIISDNVEKISVFNCGTKLYKEYLEEANIPII